LWEHQSDSFPINQSVKWMPTAQLAPFTVAPALPQVASACKHTLTYVCTLECRMYECEAQHTLDFHDLGRYDTHTHALTQLTCATVAPKRPAASTTAPCTSRGHEWAVQLDVVEASVRSSCTALAAWPYSWICGRGEREVLLHCACSLGIARPWGAFEEARP